MNRFAAIVASVMVAVAFGVTGVAAAGSSPSGGPGSTTASVGTASVTTTGGSSVISPAVPAAQVTNSTNSTAENETTANDTAENESESVAPGARLAGVLGAQQEELSGEVESRAFGHAIAGAQSNGSKAVLVANNTDQLADRLRTLEDRLESLNESFDNESIPRGMYYAKATRLSAQISTTERLLNQTADTARALPPQARMAHGVNVTRLDHLRSQARNLSGQEVARIARTIAGPQVGHQMGPRRGPPNGTPGQGPPNGSHGQGQAGNAHGGNGTGNMGQPGSNQTDTNTTSHGPPNGSAGSSNQSGQGNQGAPDSGDNTSENVDRPGILLDTGAGNGLIAAIVRTLSGLGV